MKAIEYIILTPSNYTESQLETISSRCVSPLITARYNSDSTKCIIKVYTENLPQYCESIPSYSKLEILAIIKDGNW